MISFSLQILWKTISSWQQVYIPVDTKQQTGITRKPEPTCISQSQYVHVSYLKKYYYCTTVTVQLCELILLINFINLAHKLVYSTEGKICCKIDLKIKYLFWLFNSKIFHYCSVFNSLTSSLSSSELSSSGVSSNELSFKEEQEDNIHLEHSVVNSTYTA